MDKRARVEGLVYRFGPFRLEVRERRLTREKKVVPLPRKSFDLLLLLVAEAGHLKTREELIAALWPSTIVEEEGLRIRVCALRSALDDHGEVPRYIETVRGVGYRFIGPLAIARQADAANTTRLVAQIKSKFGLTAVRGWRDLRIGMALVLIPALFGAGFFAWHLGQHSPEVTAVKPTALSIAVLPFENLSADPANAYFAARIQDEITNRLARDSTFRVIASTASAQYRSHPQDISAIARQLGAGAVLEGSIEEVGDEVHINVRLIDTHTLAPLWALTYDRKLKDALGIETEVADEVAAALNAELTTFERTMRAAPLTSNPAAYDAFQQGLAFAAGGSADPSAYHEAAYYFEQAVRFDPNFAEAWAHLTMVTAHSYNLGYDTTRAGLERIQLAATRALALAPENGESWIARGFYLYYGLRDFDGAAAAFETARQRLPNSAEAVAALALVRRSQGHWRQALVLQQQAVALDPHNFELLVQTALTYAAMRQFAQAHTTLQRARDLVPESSEVLAADAAIYQAEGKLTTADARIAASPSQAEGLVLLDVQIRQLLYRRRYPAAIAALKSVLMNPATALGDNAGYYYALLGLAEQRAGDPRIAHATYLNGRTVLLALRKSGDHSDRLTTFLALIQAGLGNAATARREAQEAVTATASDAEEAPGFRENLARVYVRLGNKDAALAILSRLLHVTSNDFMTGMPVTHALLRFDPVWDPLRHDPRFQALLHQRDARIPASKRPPASAAVRRV